ncbi:capsule assembly Wzi family protein [Dyadobacter crusticola]|uniref:capsule assembly Wzi family protein n=1 Tax=Dyadobacter crusticola TaxID=292407 RepID=UPI0004E1CAA3|nr:capsule assembly Wzi family protein [Dyadobacter crusticola]
MRTLLLGFILLSACSSKIFSQDSTFYYSLGISGAASTSKIPFWMHANQFGTVPQEGSFGLAKAAFYKIYNPNNPRFFQWTAGAELIASAGRKSDLFFSDLFIGGSAGPFELSVGQRKEYMGLSDSLLSVGGVAMSPNFRPYPKVEIRTRRFVKLLPFSDILSFRFSYSDGILGAANVHFGNVRRVEQTYLHQKSFYIKLGGKKHRLNFFAGFNHQAMWGGEDKIFTGGLQPKEAYGYVVFGKPWAASRVGNHFGTIDVAAEWKGNNWTYLLYRQSIYEDGSLINLSNLADGLNGLRFKRNSSGAPERGFHMNTILLEYMYTKNQGGEVFDFTTGTYGRDNYFNHYVYGQGWSYRGRSFGTPFIPSQSMVRKELRNNAALFTPNNRLLAYHGAISASFNDIFFNVKGSYSQNFGTYNTPFSRTIKQTSLLLDISSPIFATKSNRLAIMLAADFGELFPKSAAVLLGWRKSGFIR